MSEHHDAPKAHEPHAVHEEHTKGPHDEKEINPKMASDIAYWAKEFGVTGDKLHEAIRRAPVIFQEVVHSHRTGEAVCDEQAEIFGGDEWTYIRMPDSAIGVESVYAGLWLSRVPRGKRPRPLSA